MPYASLACDMTSDSEVAVAAWGALQVLYAFAFAFREEHRHFCPQRNLILDLAQRSHECYH